MAERPNVQEPQTASSRHQAALAGAIDRARQTFQRQQQAARHCVSGEAKRKSLQASADKAQAILTDLEDAAEAFATQARTIAALLQDHQLFAMFAPDRHASCELCLMAAEAIGPPRAADVEDPFRGPPYRTDTGTFRPAVLDAEGRLRIVPTMTAEQCEIALRRTDLQAVVRKSIERHQRTLAKAGAA